MELTDKEKKLLTLYNRFYGKPFDPYDFRCLQNFQNMYCILQTVPSSVGSKVEKLGDFKMEDSGVFSNTLDTELTRLSRQLAAEVKKFNKNNSEVKHYLPVAMACFSPDVDLAADQGIAPYSNFSLLARVCLFVSQGHTTVDEVRAYLNSITYDISHEIRGNRNLYQTDYIISLLLGYGLLCNSKDHNSKGFDETIPNLTKEEKELLNVYYKFYGNYFDPTSEVIVDNATNVYCLLQSIPEDVGIKLDKKYEFLMSTTMDTVTSGELKQTFSSLESNDKIDAIKHYYNNGSEDMIPIGSVLKNAGFDTVKKIGRLAKACVFAQNYPEASSIDVLNYLNNLDKTPGYPDEIDLNLNKKIVIFMERYNVVKRKVDNSYQQNEGFVKKLARVFGGQKTKN